MKGDLILRVAGQSVNDAEDVIRAILKHPAGESIVVRIRRIKLDDPTESDDSGNDISVVLGTLPSPQRATPVPAEWIYGFKAQNDGQVDLVPLRISQLALNPWTLTQPSKVPSGKAPTGNAQPHNAPTPLPTQMVAPNGQYIFRPTQQPSMYFPVQPSAVRVERSDVEKQLSELTKQVEALTGALSNAYPRNHDPEQEVGRKELAESEIRAELKVRPLETKRR
jgi:hypothetical protein